MTDAANALPREDSTLWAQAYLVILGSIGVFALGALLIVLGVYLGAVRGREADDEPADTRSDLAPADPENRSP